jgi:hypothetical protein
VTRSGAWFANKPFRVSKQYEKRKVLEYLQMQMARVSSDGCAGALLELQESKSDLNISTATQCKKWKTKAKRCRAAPACFSEVTVNGQGLYSGPPMEGNWVCTGGSRVDVAGVWRYFKQ